MANSTVTLKFIADTKGATSAMDAIIDKTAQLKTEISATSIAAGQSFQGLGASATGSESALLALVNSINQIETALNDARNNTALNNLAQSSEQSSQSVIELKTNLASINQQLQELGSVSIDDKVAALDNIFFEADKALKILNTDLKVSEADAQELYNTLNQISSLKPQAPAVQAPTVQAPTGINTQQNLQQLFTEITSIQGAFDNIDVSDINVQLNIMENIIRDTESAVDELEREFGQYDQKVIQGRVYVQELKNDLAQIKSPKIIDANEPQKVVSLRTQLKNAKQELDALIEGSNGKITPQIIRAAKSAGQLSDRFGDLNALVNSFNPDAKFKALANVTQGVVGAFTALQGAMALTGTESEDVNKALLKVNGALALSQGIDQVLQMKDSFTQLKAVVLSYFVGAEAASGVTAQQAIAAEAAAAANLQAALAAEAAATTDAELALAKEAVTAATAQQAAAARAATVATEAEAAANIGAASSLGILRLALIATGIGAFIVLLGTLIANWDKVKKTISENVDTIKKVFPSIGLIIIGVQALQQKFGTFSTFLKSIFGGIKGFFVGLGSIIGNVLEGNISAAIDSAKNLGTAITDGFNKGLEEGKLSDAIDKKLEGLKKRNLQLEIDISVARSKGQDTFALEKELLTNELEIAKGHYKSLQQARDENDAEAVKSIIAAQDKLSDLINKNNAERLSSAKKNAQDIENAERKLAQAIEDIQKQLGDKILSNRLELEINPEVKFQLEAIKADQELQAFIDDIKAKNAEAGVQVNVDTGLTPPQEEAVEILRKQAAEILAKKQVQLEVELKLLAANEIEDELVRNLEIFEANQKAFEDALRAKGATEIQVENAVAKEVERIKNEAYAKRITQYEEFGIATVQQSVVAGETEIEAEKRKQEEILKIQLQAQRDRLALLEGSKAPQDLVDAEKLKASIGDIESKLKGFNDTTKKSFGEVLGLSEEQVNQFDNFSQKLGGLAQAGEKLVGAYIAGEQAKLDEEQRINDERKELLDERLSDVQQQFENELALAKQGYANNVDAKKEELDKLNAEKQKALERDKIIAEKRAKLAKAEAIAGLVTAGANVAIAVSNVLKSAKDPITAVIATIEAIAMVAAFITQLTKIKSNTGLGKGGLLQGDSHNFDGSGGIPVGTTGIMVEGDEFVTNKRTTKKYFNFIKELNEEKFTESGMQDLKRILEDNNIALNNDSVNEVNMLYEQKQAQYFAPSFDYKHQKEAVKVLNKIHEHQTNTPLVTVGADGTIVETVKGNTKIIRNK